MLFVVKQRSVRQKGKLYRPGDRIVINDPDSILRLTGAGIVAPLEDCELPEKLVLPPFESFTRRQLMDVLKVLKASWRVKMTNVELYGVLSEAFAEDPKRVMNEVIALGV